MSDAVSVKKNIMFFDETPIEFTFKIIMAIFFVFVAKIVTVQPKMDYVGTKLIAPWVHSRSHNHAWLISILIGKKLGALSVHL